MSLEGIDLGSLTEQELRDLKRKRTLAFLPIQAEWKADALAIQAVMEVLQQDRYASYYRIAGESPDAVSTRIG